MNGPTLYLKESEWICEVAPPICIEYMLMLISEILVFLEGCVAFYHLGQNMGMMSNLVQILTFTL